MTTSSMAMEIKAISEALEWVTQQEIQHVLIATDSMSTLEKIRCGNLYADWVGLIKQSRLKKVTWLFCPGHAGVCGNERADKLAGTAFVGGGLTLDPRTVINLAKEGLAKKPPDAPSYTLETIVEKGVERGAGQQSQLCGVARRVTNQLMMETISRWTLMWTLQRREEHLWQCAACNETYSAPK